jgi:uncharacterized protein (TIGR03643 family)
MSQRRQLCDRVAHTLYLCVVCLLLLTKRIAFWVHQFSKEHSTWKKQFRTYPKHSICEPEPQKRDVEWVIWAAWSDRYTFEQIERETGLRERDVIRFMRLHHSTVTFKRWRRRVRQSSIKHARLFASRRRSGRLIKPKESEVLTVF